MKEFTSSSGAKVVINSASFKDANNLKINILRDEGAGGYSVNIVDTSPAVLAALWPCLAQCLYNDAKVTPETFEAEGAREDYYEVLNACVTENLRPFMKGLNSASLLSESLKTTPSQKPK